EALDAQALRIRAGQSIRQWLELLTTSFDELESLIAFDIDPRRREGPLREVFEALEAYERQRIGGRLPVPDCELTAEEYGQWWSGLVEYSAILRWERECQAQHPVLLQVTPEVHQKTCEKLGELLEKKRALEPETIRQRWLQDQLQYRDQPWAKFFQLRT